VFVSGASGRRLRPWCCASLRWGRGDFEKRTKRRICEGILHERRELCPRKRNCVEELCPEKRNVSARRGMRSEEESEITSPAESTTLSPPSRHCRAQHISHPPHIQHQGGTSSSSQVMSSSTRQSLPSHISHHQSRQAASFTSHFRHLQVISHPRHVSLQSPSLHHSLSTQSRHDFSPFTTSVFTSVHGSLTSLHICSRQSHQSSRVFTAVFTSTTTPSTDHFIDTLSLEEEEEGARNWRNPERTLCGGAARERAARREPRSE